MNRERSNLLLTIRTKVNGKSIMNWPPLRNRTGMVFLDGQGVMPRQYIRPEPKVGRNDSCPCGSGKKI